VLVHLAAYVATPKSLAKFLGQEACLLYICHKTQLSWIYPVSTVQKSQAVLFSLQVNPLTAIFSNSDNNILSIGSDSLQLPNLEELNLNGNKIYFIENHAFKASLCKKSFCFKLLQYMFF